MKPRAQKRLLLFLASLFGAYLAISCAAAVFLTEITIHVSRRAVNHREQVARYVVATFHDVLEDIQIVADDGTPLRAWYVAARNSDRGTVVLLHGLTDNREGVAGYAQMFLSHGYSVLLPDSRAHGESGGQLATYGVLERYDVRNWALWASQRSKGCVYLFGESMGAAIALQAEQVTPELCAVVVESPFSEFREIAYDRMEQIGGIPDWASRTLARPTLELALIYARLRYGVTLAQADPERATMSSQVPTLLIAGTADRNIPPRHALAIHQRAPQHTELWLVTGADHGAAVAVDHAAFEDRVLGWFEHHNEHATSSGNGT